MTDVNTVFSTAMSHMDELSATGVALHPDTVEYQYRTPGIINTLISELKILMGESGTFMSVSNLSDTILEADDTYCVGVLPYGLAAALLLDENPTAAAFFQQRYEELRLRWLNGRKGEFDTGWWEESPYGHIEYGEFARW